MLATSTLVPNSNRESKSVAPAVRAASQVEAPSRREFLYYIWGASIALLIGEAGAGLIWFALPRFKEGTFGGIFNFPPDQVPGVEKAPYNRPMAASGWRIRRMALWFCTASARTWAACRNGRRVTTASSVRVMDRSINSTANILKGRRHAAWIAFSPC